MLICVTMYNERKPTSLLSTLIPGKNLNRTVQELPEVGEAKRPFPQRNGCSHHSRWNIEVGDRQTPSQDVLISEVLRANRLSVGEV